MTRYGGLADSLLQAVTFDKELLDARTRKQRQHARVEAGAAKARRVAATQSLRAARAETKAVKSTSSRGAVQAEQERQAAAKRIAVEKNLSTVAKKGVVRDAAEADRVAKKAVLDAAAAKTAAAATVVPGTPRDPGAASLVSPGSANVVSRVALNGVGLVFLAVAAVYGASAGWRAIR